MEPWHGPARALVPLLSTLTVWTSGGCSLSSGCLHMTSRRFHAEEEAPKCSVSLVRRVCVRFPALTHFST